LGLDAFQDVNEAVTALKGEDAGKRKAALKYLTTAEVPPGRQKEVGDELLILANVGKDDEKVMALKAMEKWVTPDHTKQLLDMLDQKTNKEARQATIRALGKLKDESCYEALAKQLTLPAYRQTAMEALCDAGMNDKEKAETKVWPYLKGKSDNATKEAACKVLAKIGTSRSQPELQPLTNQTGKGVAAIEVRSAALQAIEEIKSRGP
jgi:HEAT repeat protein